MTGERLLLAVALLAPLACTSKPSNNNYLPPTGSGGSGGTGGTTPNGMVEVTITSPTDGAAVTQNSSLTVTATVDDMGSDFIDSTSVTAVLTAGGSTDSLAVGELVSSGSDSYSGTISIGAFPSGTYTLTVSAGSSGGATGKASVSIMIAGGPTLIVNSPVEGKSYNGSLTIEILVDPGASPPTVTVAGMPVMAPALFLAVPASSTSMYDTYRATIAFGPSTPPPAPALAFPPLSGVQLLDATESNGTTTSEVKRTFTIDTTGPTITNTVPQPGEIMGGVVTISATVSDDSGVLPSSVIAVIGDQEGNPIFSLSLQPDLTGNYSALFDTANLTQCQPQPSSLCIVYPSISFRATDLVGNESSVGYEFAVDNIPPLADLDPPQMRQMRLGVTGYECSFLFDPLSVNQDVGDMPNDGCMVPQVFDLRARIEDDGNHATGLKITPIATVDPDNTNIYILNVPAGSTSNPPLVVDTDGDGNCDSINPLLIPTTGPLTQSDQVLKLRLAGVPPAGNANFDSGSDSSLPNAECGKGTDVAPAKVLCQLDGFEQPTIAIGYSDNLPAIWSVEPIDANYCLGGQFDTLANNVPNNQWLCIAVGTTDLAGNKSVSAPIRVFVQYNETGGFCATPPASAGPPPNCNGTFDAASNTAASGTCQTQKFTGTDYYCAPGAC